MNQQQFEALTNVGAKLDQIYAILPKPAANGEAPAGVAGLFGPDRPEPIPPVRPPRELPAGFEWFFGPEPARHSVRRGQWDRDLVAYGGLVDLTESPSYLYKAHLSSQAGLGVPMAYRYNGEVRVVFEKRPGLYRSIDVWDDQSQYDTFIEVAKNPSIR